MTFTFGNCNKFYSYVLGLLRLVTVMLRDFTLCDATSSSSTLEADQYDLIKK
jgi:hypothetical protein